MLNITKKILYDNIRTLRDRLLKAGMTYPLDIFEICRKYSNLEIASVPFTTPGLRGMVQLADISSPYHCILVNSNLSLKEQNFHGIHELMHITFHNDNNGATFNCFDKLQPNQNAYIEWMANEGAAELMLPHDVLLPYIKQQVHTFDDNIFGVLDMIDEIANSYGLSRSVVQNRIDSLKYEIFQHLNGCDISEIKILSHNEQLRQGIKLDSLIDIENKRLNFALLDSDYERSFFSYSEPYRNLLAI